jgi:hypothetical protein
VPEHFIFLGFPAIPAVANYGKLPAGFNLLLRRKQQNKVSELNSFPHKK